MRCEICKKIGLEEDFLFVPDDDLKEVPICYDCATEDQLKLKWTIDDADED